MSIPGHKTEAEPGFLKALATLLILLTIGDPSRIRTCNPRSRNPLLYPVELWDRRALLSIANMKNPLSRQAHSEPFSPVKRQTLSGGPAFGPPSTQCGAAAERQAYQVRLGHVASDLFSTLFTRPEPVPF